MRRLRFEKGTNCDTQAVYFGTPRRGVRPCPRATALIMTHICGVLRRARPGGNTIGRLPNRHTSPSPPPGFIPVGRCLTGAAEQSWPCRNEPGSGPPWSCGRGSSPVVPPLGHAQWRADARQDMGSRPWLLTVGLTGLLRLLHIQGHRHGTIHGHPLNELWPCINPPLNDSGRAADRPELTPQSRRAVGMGQLARTVTFEPWAVPEKRGDLVYFVTLQLDANTGKSRGFHCAGIRPSATRRRDLRIARPGNSSVCSEAVTKTRVFHLKG